MTKKTSKFEEDEDSFILEDEDEGLGDDSDEDFDLVEIKQEEISNKRRLIEEKLEEYKLKRQLEEDFDF